MIESKKTIAIPPGATIKEQLIDRRMSQKEFAARMDMSEKHISKLINGEVQLTHDVAMRLEMVLGVPAQFWNNLEGIYREKLLRVQAENDMEADLEIVKSIPYSEMAKNNWVEKTRNAEEKVINCRKFFEVVRLSILSDQLIPNIACRRLGEGTIRDYTLLSWAQKAKISARDIPTAPVNIDRLRSLIPSIRLMTRQNPADFCPVLIKELAECGVALVILPHIGGSFLHGASFCDGSKIVIGMTLRGKDADRFWFSLFHEIGHVVHEDIYKLHGTTAADEDAADAFARNALIPDDLFASFVSKKRFDKNSIIEFANTVSIDPGIVVGRLQNEGKIHFSRFRDLKTQYELSD